jgi:transposase
MQSTMPTIGFDLGDRFSAFCELDRLSREVVERGQARTTRPKLEQFFRSRPRSLVIMEAGQHSAWVSRLAEGAGHEVVVANPRMLPLIYKNARKCDDLDAENLARLGSVDLKLLAPIKHRREETPLALGLFRARDALVGSRTDLVNMVRSVAKSHGVRIRSSSTKCFHQKAREDLPPKLLSFLGPAVDIVESISLTIRGYDQQIEQLGREKYPETVLLMQVNGVGMLTALAFRLTLEDLLKFGKNRAAGAYLGLTTRRDQSGSSDKELGISKQGDPFVRRLLVQSAHYILGPFGQDSDLRRWGLGLAARGGKAAKKRAIVAVARKVSVLLLALWRTGEVYEPLRNSGPGELKSAAC